MAATAMDLDGLGANGSSLNIHRSGGMVPATSNLSDVVGSYRPTKLFKRDDVKEGRSVPSIQSIDYDDTGELLMTSSSDETIQIYNVKEGRHEKALHSKKYGVKLAKFTHTSSSIIYASTKQNNAIRYLATHDNSFIRYFEGHEAKVTGLAVHPGSDNFVSCAQDNTVRIWDTQSRSPQGQLNLNNPTLVAYDPSGTVFAVACPSSGSILLYDSRNFDKAPISTVDVVAEARSIDGECLMKGWTVLQFSNDGNSILLGTKGKGHFVFDAFDGTLKAYLHRPNGSTRRPAPGDTATNGSASLDSSGDCCFTPDGRFVVSGSSKEILVWDLMQTPNARGKVLDAVHTLTDKREPAVLAVNPRFNLFATADQDLVLWLPDFTS